MDRAGCYNYKVEAYDVDFTCKSTYISIIDYILKAAGDDADANGFGVTDLNHDNCSWVLTRMAVEFKRRLKQYEKFKVRTWVNEINRIGTTRNMLLLDADDNEIASSVTQWSVIDLDKRIALDVRNHVEHEGKIIDHPSPIDKPSRIRKVEPTEINTHKVVYSDMDFNRHVNSTKYLEWMFDMLPLEWITDRLIHRIDMNYLHEALFGQELTIGFENGEKSVFEVLNDSEEALCRVSFDWSK